MSSKPQTVRVQFSLVEDCRRVVFDVLAESGLSQRHASRIAGVVSARLRDAGQLGSSLEQHYSAADAAALMGGRCSAWAVKHARQGDFGSVSCDGGDWLIPASGLRAYLDRFSVNVKVTDKVTDKVNVKNSGVMVEFAEGKIPKENGVSLGRPGDRGVGRGQTDIRGDGLAADVVSSKRVRSNRIVSDVVVLQMNCSSPDRPG